MSADTSPRSSIERTRLLRSAESFEIDDLEAIRAPPKHTNGSANGRLRGKKSWKEEPPWRKTKCIWISLVVAVILILGSIMWLQKSNIVEQIQLPLKHDGVTATSAVSTPVSTPNPLDPPPKLSSGLEKEKFVKPNDFKIIGLIFFGRPPVVAVLDCYLKRNLVSNGGWLDEVHWVVNTDKKDDIKWLDELVKTHELYKKITIPELGYNHIWSTVKKEHMYIKIDDDMVYFDDNAISNVVYTKVKHPDSFAVVANLINSPETGWLHYHFGAIHAYLPETKPPPEDPSGASLGPKAWRASKLPIWDEEGEMHFEVTMDKPDDGAVLEPDNPAAPPFKGHRWLPLPDPEKNLHRTPYQESRYDPYGPDWKSWALAAQAHYSLLQNIESGTLDQYHYGTTSPKDHEGVWNTGYGRMNINFMAIWGKDVLDNLPFSTSDDEMVLSQEIPLKLQRPVLVNTHALAAHFSFRTQHEIYETDLLSRYRAMANEMICGADNQIPIPEDE
ncbi:MAG: hypothetical protein LQ351_007854 [Letrouitia transgressa]|nr:MAG: hypothetical protein LQ351_007854 [Letrouitia transgressa]